MEPRPVRRLGVAATRLRLTETDYCHEPEPIAGDESRTGMCRFGLARCELGGEDRQGWSSSGQDTSHV
jgi:hypothetical protein